MLVLQANEHGIPVVMEFIPGESSNDCYCVVTAERWREILSDELDLSETDRPIVPIQAKL